MSGFSPRQCEGPPGALINFAHSHRPESSTSFHMDRMQSGSEDRGANDGETNFNLSAHDRDEGPRECNKAAQGDLRDRKSDQSRDVSGRERAGSVIQPQNSRG